MAGPITSAGAQPNSTKYAALSMGARQMTGLVTNRSPYRDGAVPYLVGKFYGGTRFDTIWDGLNREISQKLTDVRRAGFSRYNANIEYIAIANSPTASFFSWKYIQDGKEVVTVLRDTLPSVGLSGGQLAWMNTTGSDVLNNPLSNKAAGAGPARFLGVNTELFITDGVRPQKIIGTSKTWKPATLYTPGDLITDSNGNLQQAQTYDGTANIVSVQQFDVTTPAGATIHYVMLVFDLPGTLPSPLEPVAPLVAMANTFLMTGLTGATWLNGTQLTNVVPTANPNVLLGITAVTHAAYGPLPDTGTIVGFNTGTAQLSGSAAPTWSATQQAVTTDNDVFWICYGKSLKDWGLLTPKTMPTTAAADATEMYWQPNTFYNAFTAVIDNNGAIQLCFGLTTGFIQPKWNTVLGGFTEESAFPDAWQNGGTAGAWFASTAFTPNTVILDSNGNLQKCLVPFTADTVPPTWSTTPGGITTDNGINAWICFVPGTQLLFGTLQYASSWHSIDGTVSTASPVNARVVNGILGNAGPLGFAIQVTGLNPVSDGMTTDQASQIDQVWVWRTPEGQATLIELAQLPVDNVNTGQWTYLDVLPDTSLNAFIAAPVADEANPPQASMTAPVYYLQRVWGIVDNMVVYSEGPDAVVGNGNTQFPPLNFIPYLAQPVRLIPVTLQGGALIVLTTDGAYIILGTGTSSDPFYTTVYYASVDISGYNAVDVFNNAIFCMESNYKISMMAIEYPFNPQTGYTEIGFPIADQFVKLSTGGSSDAVFDPASAYVSWHNATSAEEAMFVGSGKGQWFRFSMINPPESGFLWSPMGIMTGSGGANQATGALQSIEVKPGTFQLLGANIGEDGNINFVYRDPNVNADWDDFFGAYVFYPSWDAKGVTELCTTGQWAEVAHISTKSKAVGKRPVVSVLFNEIEPSAERPYSILQLGEKSNDPPRNRRSLSAYSDRYVLAQNGMEMTGDCLLTMFDYGAQNEPDELYDWGIFATVHDEREEAAAKV